MNSRSAIWRVVSPFAASCSTCTSSFSPGERVNRPDFGAGLRRLVFSPSSSETATLLQATVFQSLDRWLGQLIDVDRVDAAFEDGRLDVAVSYTLKARGDQQVLNLEVTL